MKKLVLTQKQIISTRKRHAEHRSAGQNTQHMPMMPSSVKSSCSQPLRRGPQALPPPQLPTSYSKKLSCFFETEKFTFMILVGTFRPLKSWETLLV